MYALNIDPNNPLGNPDAAQLRQLNVEMVRYTTMTQVAVTNLTRV